MQYLKDMYMNKILIILLLLFTFNRYNLFIRSNCITENIGIVENDKVKTTPKSLLHNVYKSGFTYKKDKFEEIITPSQAYYEYLNGGLVDDCDGWVSLAYHILTNNGADCYYSIIKGYCKINTHSILTFNYNNMWYINNYSNTYQFNCLTKEQALKQFCKRFNYIAIKCDTKYSYTTGLFYGG